MRKFLKRCAQTAPRHGFASRAMRLSGVESVLIRGFRAGILILMWRRRVKIEGFHGVKAEVDGHSASDLYTQSHRMVLGEAAVDHSDTDNPHTHILLRGRAANGQNTVVAPNYWPTSSMTGAIWW